MHVDLIHVLHAYLMFNIGYLYHTYMHMYACMYIYVYIYIYIYYVRVCVRFLRVCICNTVFLIDCTPSYGFFRIRCGPVL